MAAAAFTAAQQAVTDNTTSGVALAAAAVSPAAQADNPACPADRVCLFEHDDFLGGRAVFDDDDSDLRDNNWEGTTRPVHNGASSMINNKGVSASLRSDAAQCSGDSYTALADSEDRDFSNNVFDNEASCIQIN
ncbi:peptidase inhibitor family I36 protein [Saccharopolyspora sp. 5N708]|uniref:peptidase inhibitor family I36 protein n=1 Tax=Saccharopolyspora sp. 5N708 TaxID=3457424 RepID=UPI003FD166AE